MATTARQECRATVKGMGLLENPPPNFNRKQDMLHWICSGHPSFLHNPWKCSEIEQIVTRAAETAVAIALNATGNTKRHHRPEGKLLQSDCQTFHFHSHFHNRKLLQSLWQKVFIYQRGSGQGLAFSHGNSPLFGLWKPENHVESCIQTWLNGYSK